MGGLTGSPFIDAVYARWCASEGQTQSPTSLRAFLDSQARMGMVWAIHGGPYDSAPGWESRWPWSEPSPFAAVVQRTRNPYAQKPSATPRR